MILLALSICALLAQAGDKKGEEQPPLPATMKVPPAPVLAPSEALKTFKIAPGFRLELAACEPLVQDPVAMTFDADGRMWVAEMIGYMPDVDGKGEEAPVGRIVVLEDTKGEGTYDKRTVFLDRLVLPRALCLVGDGLLIAEPPALFFCRATKGDFKCNEKTLVEPNYCSVKVVEHTANGLLRAMDNWIYSANSTLRLRRMDGKWVQGTTKSRGQWGITQDDVGRLFYNSNPDDLRGDLVPCWSPEAQNLKSARVNVRIVKDQTVWPGRVTPGVNRGYQKGILREDGTLKEHTSACGPVIYRGDNFPVEFQGNAFVCEPAANLVCRRVLSEDAAGVITGRNPYEKTDFLTSTDERFRPVNLYNGPDGCLYLVDMYRGVIQHRLYVTTFLRKQMLDRGLDKGVGLGRIYRVVSDAKPAAKKARLSAEPSAELAKRLTTANGWVRDTAQRILVDRADVSAAPELRRIAAGGGDPVARLHALFALDGIKQLDPATIEACIADPNAHVSAAAQALKDSPGLLGPLDALVLAATTAPNLPDAKLAGKELDLLVRLMARPEWESALAGRDLLLARIAGRVIAAGKPEPIEELLELAACQSTAARWRQHALLDGIEAAKKPVTLANRSAALVKLTFAEDEKTRARAKAIYDWVSWPGKAVDEPAPPRATPLTAPEKERWERGRRQFAASCAACHQLSGLGEEAKGPPLVDSDWVLGSEQRLVRIVANGLHGPLTVSGRKYTFVQEMPAVQNASSEELAEILTYIRREWGNQASAVEPDTVRKVRAATEDREEPWTQAELLKIP